MDHGKSRESDHPGSKRGEGARGEAQARKVVVVECECALAQQQKRGGTREEHRGMCVPPGLF